jgi:hypothetical protein
MEDEFIIDPEVKKRMKEIEKQFMEKGHKLGEWQGEGKGQFSNGCKNVGCLLRVRVEKIDGYDGMVFAKIGDYGFPPQNCLAG